MWLYRHCAFLEIASGLQRKGFEKEFLIFVWSQILHKCALLQLFSGKNVGGDETIPRVFPTRLIPQYIALLEK